MTKIKEVKNNVVDDISLETNALCRFKPSDVLISITYKDSCFEVLDCVTVLNREENNVQCNGTYYTVNPSVISDIEQCINNSNIYNVKFDSKAYNKLSDLSRIVYMDGVIHEIFVHTENGRYEYELENIHYYKRYYKYVEPYNAGFIILEKTVKELAKAGIEFKELQDSIK